MSSTDAMLWDIPAKSPKSVYEKWDETNPQVYEDFRRLALRLIHRGVQHYGAKAICEVIRFHKAMHATAVPKVNNNITSYFARKFIGEYPQYKDFFETRRSKLDFA